MVLIPDLILLHCSIAAGHAGVCSREFQFLTVVSYIVAIEIHNVQMRNNNYHCTLRKKKSNL